ncbi:hypothetical protein [Cryobacterium sp. PH31-O1]|uniref:hypothetical protein n=1 Tax=Cryobacterium sp. PH31-O1 TaxID=3046306 RepID=UPI0024BBA3F7|nr:hypothetical protein [Cryobacterium sp. PH31-O1]MDJ0336625.1 hypothetical protein [Cryobacterium sp. PH31-O1]
MRNKSKALFSTLAGAIAIALFVPTAAQAAPQTAPAQFVAEASEVDILASSLETLFTDVITYDTDGISTYDVAAATELLGARQALAIETQLEQARASASSNTESNVTAKSSTNFVDCMVQGSVLGLIGGLVIGTLAELVRQKLWIELAEAVLPKLVRAGIGGGVIGIAGGLAVAAVQCSVFE